MFGLVFITRYLDLVTNFVSPYNTIMKVFFLSSTIATVYLIYTKFKATYDGNHDTFRMEFLVLPCTLLALVVNHEFSPMEVGKSFIGPIFMKTCALFLVNLILVWKLHHSRF